jgi:outer membrane protein assembly factor BamD (BamD/ComL family)
VARAILSAILLACALCAQQAPVPVYPEPPEEDETLATARQYSFNPLQAKKEIDAGNFYFKKGNYRAAANRYREATLWDDSSAEAFYKLGEAYEKMASLDRAREAYTRFLALSADKGKANDVRKRMARWPPAK